MNKYPVIRIVYDYKRQASNTRKGVVSIEVAYDRKRKRINTGVKVYPSQWNNSYGVIKTLDAEELNNTIHQVYRNVSDWINQLRKNREIFSFEKLDRFLTSAQKGDENFIDYVERKIESRRDIRESTRRSHRKLVNALKDFGKIVLFSEVIKERIKEFDMWLHGRDYVQLTIHSYHKILKIYINQALDEGLIDNSPYLGIKIERGKSKRRKFLNEKELRAVMNAELPTASLENVRDLFVFQCFTGIAYADLKLFDFSKVEERDGRYILRDTRWKSGEDYYLVLLSPAVEILKKYDFKLNVLTNQKYNLYLKVIANAAGLGSSLTSHMARHTFAVYCLNHGVPIEILSKMMGHTDIRTTQLYAKVANKSVESAFELLENNLKGKVEKPPFGFKAASPQAVTEPQKESDVTYSYTFKYSN